MSRHLERSSPRALLPHLALALTLAACSDSESPIDSGDDPLDGPWEEVACEGVQPAATSGVPLDRIPLGNVPETLEPPLVAWVGSDEEELSGYTPVMVGEDGGLELVAPLHPSSDPDGGSVRIRIGDGTDGCAAFDFTVAPLPPADGELEAFADLIEAALAEQTAVLETTREEILEAPFEELPASLSPLALAWSALDGPDNENSFRAFIAGTAPEADEARLDVLEPLLARVGLRDDLAARLAERGIEPGAPAPTEALPDAGTPQPFERGLCTPDLIGDQAGLLDHCMSKAADAAFEVGNPSGQMLEDAGNLLGVLGLAPGLGTPAGVASFATWLYMNQQKGNAAMLPSFLGPLEVNPDPAEFFEDQDGPGSWTAGLTASNAGWDMGKELLNGLLQSAGAADAFGTAEVGGPEIGDLLKYVITNPVANEILGEVELEDFEQPAETFGPVFLGPDQAHLIESRIATGSSIEMDEGAFQYDPVEVGTSTLAVRTAEGRFGGEQATADTELTVKPIQMNFVPDEVVLAAEETRIFELSVVDSQDPEMAEVDDSDLQGTVERVTYLGDGDYDVEYRAPDEPDPGDVDRLVARHTATSGAREFATEERIADATIRFDQLRISPRFECLDPGGTLQFTAEMTSDEDPDVVWDADVGDIDQNGLYEAPPTVPGEGTATITAHLADDQNVRDSVRIQIGGCSCQLSVVVNTLAADTDDSMPNFELTEDGSAVTGISWLGTVQIAAVGVGFTPTPLEPGSIPVGTTGDVPVSVNGTLEGVGNFDSYFKADGDETELPPPTASITENDGDVLAGSVAGSVWLWSDDAPGSFSMNFRLVADPGVSTQTLRRCIIE